jgi:hypothetical protein
MCQRVRKMLSEVVHKKLVPHTSASEKPEAIPIFWAYSRKGPWLCFQNKSIELNWPKMT